jgi:hypothetical protein
MWKNNGQILFFALVSIFSFLLNGTVKSQDPNDCDPAFIEHLVMSGNYRDALYLINKADSAGKALSDELSYFRGWSYYSIKELDKSATSFLKVSNESKYYLKSYFFAAYDNAHIGNYKEAADILSGTECSNDKFRALKNFELSGVYLLEGDTAGFRETMVKTDRSFFEITESADKLNNVACGLESHKRKSPLVAGVISGIIPGSGKLYSGKKAEAISSFLATTGLGFVAYENIHRRGFVSFPSIFFTTAFALTYASNIHGAVVTAHIVETEYRENVKNSILISLHIPLRNTFNR